MKVMYKKRAVYFIIAVKIVVVSVLLTDSGCKREKEDKDTFSVAFMTDIHLQPERNAVEGFSSSLDTVNSMKPDFIITGGDLIMDALGQRYGRTDSLYNLYQEVVKKATMPVHNTMGNHEIYGIYRKSGADPAHPEYGEKMYEKRLGPLYYSYLHKGWKFMVINSIEDTGRDSYTGLVDSVQIDWIREELKNTDPETPIVISTHIPFVTAMTQVLDGSTVSNDSSLVVYNSREVVDLFKDHNLRLVLQGHLHLLEEINIDGVQYITSGAVCGAWWNGPRQWSEEGFLYLTFGKNDFTWRYVDYGWKVD